jgi:hypothetical protein
MTTGVARRVKNDYEELMTARARRDSALLRRASGCDSGLRSLTVSNATGMRAAWQPARMCMICVASVKSNRGVSKATDEDAIIIERVYNGRGRGRDTTLSAGVKVLRRRRRLASYLLAPWARINNWPHTLGASTSAFIRAISDSVCGDLCNRSG